MLPPRSTKSKRNCVKMNKNAFLARSENGNAGILQSWNRKNFKNFISKPETEFSLVAIFTLL
jgi:hypothetical protein